MGSTTSSTQLKYSPRVSFVTQDKDNNEFIIRTLVTLAEIGLSFIPGVGQIGQAAIALVGTGIQAGLDASFQGKISPWTIGTGLFGASIPITSGFRNIGRVGRVLEEEGLPFSSALKFKAFDKPLEAAKDVNDLIKSQRVLEAQAFGNKAGGEVIEEGSDFINREKLSLDAQRILAEFNEWMKTNRGLHISEVRKQFQTRVINRLGQNDLKLMQAFETSFNVKQGFFRLRVMVGPDGKVINKKTFDASKWLRKTRNAVDDISDLMDPNDVAKMILRPMFKKIDKEWNKFLNPYLRKFIKEPGKVKKLIDAKRQMFDYYWDGESEWVQGVRVLQTFPNGNKAIIIYFNRETTRGKAGGHIATGKRPVTTILTSKQLNQFVKSESKGKWYLENVSLTKGKLGAKAYGVFTGMEITETAAVVVSLLNRRELNDLLFILRKSKQTIIDVLDNKYWLSWDDKFVKAMKNYGIRRGVNTALKPTAFTKLFAGTISTGINTGKWNAKSAVTKGLRKQAHYKSNLSSYKSGKRQTRTVRSIIKLI